MLTINFGLKWRFSLSLQYSYSNDIIILFSLFSPVSTATKITPGLSTNKQWYCLLLLKMRIHVASSHLTAIGIIFGNILACISPSGTKGFGTHTKHWGGGGLGGGSKRTFPVSQEQQMLQT